MRVQVVYVTHPAFLVSLARSHYNWDKIQKVDLSLSKKIVYKWPDGSRPGIKDNQDQKALSLINGGIATRAGDNETGDCLQIGPFATLALPVEIEK